MFLAALGLTADDAESFRADIMQAILGWEATEEQPTPYGRRFVVDIDFQRAKNDVLTFARVRTAWIIRNDEDFPRLTSCFVR